MNPLDIDVVYQPENLSEERNPYFSQIWQAGYDMICSNFCRFTIQFYYKNIMLKEIPVRDLINIIGSTTVVRAVSMFGNRISWLTEEDGSATRFRALITQSIYPSRE